MRKFTPGPWNGKSAEVIASDGFPVVNVEKTPVLPDYQTKLGVAHWAYAPGKAYIVRSNDEVAANANLIAAAPDLYEAAERALGELMVFHKACKFRSPTVPMLVAALKKAHGEE